MRLLHSQLTNKSALKCQNNLEEVKREKDLSNETKDKQGDYMVGKRLTFILLAFLAGILFLTGVFSAILAYIGKEFGQSFVLVSGSIGAILIIVGLLLLYHLTKEIR